MSGVVISHIIDSLNDNKVFRKSESKGKEIIFSDNKDILSSKKNIILKAIPKPSTTTTSFISNPNIGVIDTETFTSIDGIQKVYALGFKTYLDENPVKYYINENELDSDKIILDMINEIRYGYFIVRYGYYLTSTI